MSRFWRDYPTSRCLDFLGKIKRTGKIIYEKGRFADWMSYKDIPTNQCFKLEKNQRRSDKIHKGETERRRGAYEIQGKH